jgi:hypothetical protein
MRSPVEYEGLLYTVRERAAPSEEKLKSKVSSLKRGTRRCSSCRLLEGWKAAVRRAAAAMLCLAAVAGCGSTETARTKQAKAAAIAAALREVESEVRATRKKLPLPPGVDARGGVALIYKGRPRGVGKAEWEAAIKKVQPRLRALANSLAAR